MLLLIRFVAILIVIACVIALPVFLMKLNAIENRKKEEKLREAAKKVMKKETPAPTPPVPVNPYRLATPHVKERFLVIEEKLKAIQEDKQWLSFEATHHVTETFPKDFANYVQAYNELKVKHQVEEDVLIVLNNMVDELNHFEKEIEEKKKTELHRQGYIIETREKDHL